MQLRRLIRRVSAWLRRPWPQRGKALGLALLGVCAAGSRTAADPQEQAQGITISLGADDFEYSEDGQTAVLAGNVRLRASDLPRGLPDVEMESQRLTVSLTPGDVVGEGLTVVRSPGVEISGEDLRLNLRTQEFHVERARSAMVVPVQGRELTVFAESAGIDAKDGQAQLSRARITTCEREHPHYALLVRKAIVVPERDRLTVYGGTIELYGVRVPLVPKLNTSLGGDDDDRGFDLAFPGHSSADGWFYPLQRRFTDPKAPLQVRANIRLAERSVVSGRLLAENTAGNLRTWVTAVRRDPREDDITESLLYDALPEVGASLTHTQGDVALSARLAGGYYREEDRRTGRRAADGAATLTLGWDWRRPLGERGTDLRAGIGTRASLYADGGSYRTLDLYAGGAHGLWHDALGELEFRHHFIAGDTPFEWDDIDLQTELYGKVSTPLVGPWGLSLAGRYDLDRSLLRDYDVGLHFSHHCLTWSLQYNYAHERLGVGVNLTDFMFGGRPRPQKAPKGTLGPWPEAARRPLQREGLGELPESAVPPLALQTDTPTEFALSPAHQQRAPDPRPVSDLRPPPSLRLASAALIP